MQFSYPVPIMPYCFFGYGKIERMFFCSKGWKISSHLNCMVMNKKNVSTSLVIAILVGSLLNLINSYDIISDGNFSFKNSIKIMLTYITPFCVSLYSSIKATKQKSN